MDGFDSSAARVVVEKYLPELESAETRELLVEEVGAFPDPAGVSEDEFPAPPEYESAADGDGRMRDYFRHWVRSWSGDLTAEIAASPQVSPDHAVVADFVADQTDLTAVRMMRVLVEELYRRRSAGLLAGATPQERYTDFRRWTNSPQGHRELLERYPQMFRMCRARVRAAGEYLVRILGEVDANRSLLERDMPGVHPGSRVEALRLGKGDTHNGGLSVAQIDFDDGGRMLYKPRPIDAEHGYNSLVAWLNERMGTGLRTVTLIPCGPGGFSEYISTGGFPGTTEDYFRLIGQLVGVLYLVKAVDIHFENVLTCAQGPVVIDAEALLTPRWRSPTGEDGSAWGAATRRVRESVAAMGVLPMVMRPPGTDRGMDIGVVGYDTGQQAPYRSLQFHNPGRDDMSARLVSAEAPNTSGNPSAGQTADLPPAAQRDTVKQEVRRVLEFAAAHRDEVADAVEERLADARFRYMNNATVFYTQLLRMTTHPDAVADARINAALLHRVALTKGAFDDVGREEVAQLAQGDVPYFTYTGRSTALSGRGATVRPEAFQEPPIATVRERITGLDAAEIERQLHLVDLSFVSRLPLEEETTGFAPEPPAAAPAAVGRSRLLKEAERIGDELVESMIEAADPELPATWIAPQIATLDDLQWGPGALAFDLYSGTPGVSLVLAGLAAETGRSTYRDAALRVIGPLEEQLRTGAFSGLKLSPGALSGVAGTVYGLVEAKRLLGIGDGVGAGDLADVVTEGIDSCTEPDLVAGTAGALAVCLSLYRRTSGEGQRERVVAAAHRAAEAELSLLSSAGPEGRATDYTGYAHGAMGIAPRLLEYADVFGDERARDAALRMVGAVFAARDPRDDDWPRTWDSATRSYAWCHGAPGMLLGALETARRAPEAVPEDGLARLAELTLQRGFGNNPTYCHGDLGNAEIVLLAAREFPDLIPPRLADGLYERLFDAVVERYPSRWDTKYAYSNSLMLGRPGFAWSILRHLSPQTYPCVLRLD
ncbi:type 2 lanthipeptide synthetase LanM family protein [Streptomonospora wellingtoniae]|uniref:Type 2 lanthipeptide synthetase LanM family protein n=1 Tax=Streptomonospora wellingtoniae TaxID=3075544 RepID=A0ABU2KT55_9ACTN|nr:type 2 lanthipeptide synthetase LanM family protein [Streptomonospora sp. DSM 45055]MDT0302481.1 type 2 lanthipeptide synthetase LanM family protein [Streptomonospora sp. DSM 45055]